MIRLAIIAAFLLGAATALSISTPGAEGCAFSRVPNTYEASRGRTAYLAGLEAAGYNLIAPEDTFFGTPRIEKGVRGDRSVADEPYIPPTVLKSNGWIESAIAQAAGPVPWDATGPALISFDCGHGIMQITSGMTSAADDGWPSTRQALVATHYLFNIGRGAAILADKWNGAPEVRPVAGTDNGSDLHIVENWYFAVWGYNGFTGPGANRSNHPMDPDYDWPRTGYSCGPASDGFGHSYGDYPYQELVFGCSARPPSVDGHELWTPLPVSLPDLDDPLWSGPLSLTNFTSSDGYARMDIPSPQPTHNDDTSRPSDALVPLLMGSPALSVSPTAITGEQNDVTIRNTGVGLLAWRAKPAQSWISVNKQAGVALSPDVPCAPDVTCDRSPTLRITVDADAATPGESGWVDIENLVTGEVVQVHVDAEPPTLPGDANCDGSVDPLDAASVLQYYVRLVPSLPCLANANVNASAGIDVVDALLILQFSAGLVASLPPP